MSTPGGTSNASNSAGSARGVHVPGGDQTRAVSRKGKREQRVTSVAPIPARSYPLPGQGQHTPSPRHDKNTTNARHGGVPKRGRTG